MGIDKLRPQLAQLIKDFKFNRYDITTLVVEGSTAAVRGKANITSALTGATVDTELADFIVRGLREEGLNVLHAADGADGWHALETGSWDVVLLDWWLPGADGLTLLRRYRR